jgi:hypothetical protein
LNSLKALRRHPHSCGKGSVRDGTKRRTQIFMIILIFMIFYLNGSMGQPADQEDRYVFFDLNHRDHANHDYLRSSGVLPVPDLNYI